MLKSVFKPILNKLKIGCFLALLFVIITPIAFLIKWQLRPEVVFISFLYDSENLIFIRENGNVILQDHQGNRLAKKKFRNFRSVIGQQSETGLFALSTDKPELLILEVKDNKIKYRTIPTKSIPNKAVFLDPFRYDEMVDCNEVVVSFPQQLFEIEFYSISEKSLERTIRSQCQIDGFISWNGKLWIQCYREGPNIYALNSSQYIQSKEVKITEAMLQDYHDIIGMKLLYGENRLILYSEKCIYLVGDDGVVSKKLDCVDKEIVSILGNTNTELYVLCRTGKSEYDNKHVFVWDKNLGELLFQSEVDTAMIQYRHPIFSPNHKAFFYSNGAGRIEKYDMFSSESQKLPSSIDKFYSQHPPLRLDKNEDRLAYYSITKSAYQSDGVRVIDLSFLDNEDENIK